ncbi:unnamed protein product, partial [Soboliphyme baturini]|uniref:Mucin-19 n=1 Tax=Soboliphyme baturini TaxID=241478 RepID=A0A183J9V1_9BILA
LLVRCTTAFTNSPQKSSKRKESLTLKERLQHVRRRLLDPDGGSFWSSSSSSATAADDHCEKATTSSSRGRFWRKRFGCGSGDAPGSRYGSASAESAATKDKKSPSSRNRRILRSFSDFDLHSFLYTNPSSSSVAVVLPSTTTLSAVASPGNGNGSCPTDAVAAVANDIEPHRMQELLWRECNSTSSIDTIAAMATTLGQDNEENFVVASSSTCSRCRRSKQNSIDNEEEQAGGEEDEEDDDDDEDDEGLAAEYNVVDEVEPVVEQRPHCRRSDQPEEGHRAITSVTAIDHDKFHLLEKVLPGDEQQLLPPRQQQPSPASKQQQQQQRFLCSSSPASSCSSSSSSAASASVAPAAAAAAAVCSSPSSSSKKPSRILKRSKAVDLTCIEGTTVVANPPPNPSTVRVRSSSAEQQQVDMFSYRTADSLSGSDQAISEFFKNGGLGS